MRKFSKQTILNHLQTKLQSAADAFESYEAKPYDFKNGTVQCSDDFSLEFHHRVLLLEELIRDIQENRYQNIEDWT